MADQRPEESSLNEAGNSQGASDSGVGSSSVAESSSANSGEASSVVVKCSHCKKIETDPEKPFKPCSRCQSEKYCSRDCTKAAWKVHKKVCAEKAQIYAAGADLKMDAPRKVGKEGFRGGLQKWQFDT